MSKFFLVIFVICIGLWVYLRPDQVHSSIEVVKEGLGYPPPPPVVPPKPEPPPGIHFLKERIKVMTDSGIRSVAAGTEVRLISQKDSTATVDDGRGEFSVDVSELSRDLDLRRESHLSGKPAAKTAAAPPPSADAGGDRSEQRTLESRIAEIDSQLFGLMNKYRELTVSDPIKGRVVADAEGAQILQKKIAALEAERSKLKLNLAKLP